MAVQFTAYVLGESPGRLTLQINLLSDGASGELAATEVWSPTQCTPALLANRFRFIIKEVWYGLDEFTVQILFKATANKPILTLPRSNDSYMDLRGFGGGLRYATGSGSDTGEILLTTRSFLTIGQYGTIVLNMDKITTRADPS